MVGNNGQIAHYNGTNWQRIESGTTLNINDIWGDYNDKTQEWEILAAAQIFTGSEDERAIFNKLNNPFDELSTTNYFGSLLVEFGLKPRKDIMLLVRGIYNKKNLTDSYE